MRRSFPGRALWAAVLSLLACRAMAGAGPGVEFIPGDGYFAALKAAVDRATATVTCYQFLFSLHHTENPNSPTRQLAEALARAAGRGVQVEIIFNRAFVGGGDEWGTLGDKNRAAAEYLSEKGVRVFFEDAPSLLHAKTVVVDRSIVLLGSSNWSSKSFSENIETNLLARDPALADKVLAAMAHIPRTPYVPEDAGAVRLPAGFLTDPDGLGLMSRRRDESSLDLYLWLLKEAQTPGAPAPLMFNVDAWAAHMGKANRPRLQLRRYVILCLRRLAETYKRIAVVFHDGADAEVSVGPVAGDAVAIPQDYWTFGWDRRLTFPGKSMFLLGRYYSERSPSKPRWRRSKYTLARDHGVSESTLDRGTIELKRADLWEVENAELLPTGGPRRPNEYSPNPLYDLAEWEKSRAKLAADCGREKFDRAAKIAVLFYEDADLDAIAALAQAEELYGRDKVERAVRKVAVKRPDNPKRNIGYLLTVIKNPDRPPSE